MSTEPDPVATHMLTEGELCRPYRAGYWLYSAPGAFFSSEVLIEEGISSGRFCRETKMGGSAQCGFSDWSGSWRFVGTKCWAAQTYPELENLAHA